MNAIILSYSDKYGIRYTEFNELDKAIAYARELKATYPKQPRKFLSIEVIKNNEVVNYIKEV